MVGRAGDESGQARAADALATRGGDVDAVRGQRIGDAAVGGHRDRAFRESRTMNLSLGERPVKAPVSTESAPWAVSLAPPWTMAAATRAGAFALSLSDAAPPATMVLR